LDEERFLRKGILESRPDSDEEDEAVDVALESDTAESNDDSDPVLESAGSEPFISPKYCSASLTASSCGTPANATTIRSGL
jgi:hypothetical protein